MAFSLQISKDCVEKSDESRPQDKGWIIQIRDSGEDQLSPRWSRDKNAIPDGRRD